jgi:elongation factor G
VGQEKDLKGLIDLLKMKAIRFEGDNGTEIVESEIPADHMEAAKARREKLLEAAAECDDSILERFLEGEEIPADEVKAALRKGSIDSRFFLVCGGSALKNIGVQLMLDGSSTTCRRRSTSGHRDQRPGRPQDQEVDPARPRSAVAALAFKTITDPNGDLTSSAHWGIQQGAQIWNPGKRQRERVGRTTRCTRRTAIDRLGRGATCSGRRGRRSPATRSATRTIQPAQKIATTGHPVSIEPASRGDRGKLPELSSPVKTRRSSGSPIPRPSRPSSAGWASSTSTS